MIKSMRTQAAATSIVLLAVTPVTAGGMPEVLVEPEVVVTEAAPSSNGKLLVPLLLIGVAAALLLGNDSEEAPPASTISDARIKRNIVHVGVTDNGLPIYRFQYLWSKKSYEGVMAQDVLRLMPEAVVKGLFGVMRVNYSKLGLSMRQVA